MILCTNETIDECFQLGVFGLPKQYVPLVRSLEYSSCALFLFNITSRELHGVYKVGSSKDYQDDEEQTSRYPTGDIYLVPNAWNRNRNQVRGSPFPAQIPFNIIFDFAPLPESSFRYMFNDGNRIRRLNSDQVKELIELFKENDQMSYSDEINTVSEGSLIELEEGFLVPPIIEEEKRDGEVEIEVEYEEEEVLKQEEDIKEEGDDFSNGTNNLNQSLSVFFIFDWM